MAELSWNTTELRPLSDGGDRYRCLALTRPRGMFRTCHQCWLWAGHPGGHEAPLIASDGEILGLFRGRFFDG
jgi:hypothetical protein